MAKGENIFFLPGASAAPHVHVNMLPPPAPNGADAARLLLELEKESRSRLQDAMRLDNNYLKAVAQAYFNPATGEEVFCLHFALNGTAHEIERARRRQQSRDEFLRALADAVAREIASSVLAEVLSGLRLNGCGND